MSKILAIETSTAAISVSLLLQDQIIEQFQLAPRQQAKLLLPMVQELLAEASIELRDLDAIAFARGPASFTGIRIAAGVTQGLAFAAELPVIPVSTLQVMAQSAAREFAATKVLVALDARMQELYWGQYVLDGNGVMRPIVDDALLRPDEVVVDSNDWFVVGDGWSAYKEELAKIIDTSVYRFEYEFYPHAQDLLTIAKGLYVAGDVVTAEMALPVYLRNKDAWKPN